MCFQHNHSLALPVCNIKSVSALAIYLVSQCHVSPLTLALAIYLVSQCHVSPLTLASAVKPLLKDHPKNQTKVALQRGGLVRGSLPWKYEQKGFRKSGLKEGWSGQGSITMEL